MPNTKVTIRTIDKQTIQLEGSFNTVNDVAVLLHGQHDFDIERQQLILSGKVLQLDDVLPELDEKSFIVLLMKKQKSKSIC